MTMQTPIRKAPETEYWMGEVLAWAEASDELYDAICELRKIPARMRMIDEDIGLIPAGLAHFDKVIAPTSYGAVSSAKDLEKARRRGNSRVRALLARFHAATGLTAPRTGREDWDRLIALVGKHEGFANRGALFAMQQHKALFSLRARCRTAPSELSQEEIDRVFSDATSDKRKSIRKGIALINRLIAMQNAIPELRDLLPPVGLETPDSPDRARRILWSSIPEALREDAEAIFRETLAKPEDRAADVTARLKAGEDPETVLAEVNASAKAQRRKIGNPAGARAGYQAAVTWLWRAADDRGGSAAATTLADLMTHETLEAACADQIERAEGSATLKDPKLTQTLNGRLTALRTLASHGLHRPDLVALIDLTKLRYWEHIVTPQQMTADAERTCKILRDTPHIAARFVRAPYILADRAMADIARARADSDRDAEDRGLRLHAVAAMYAIQLSRPVRTSNLIRVRERGGPEAPGNMEWIKDRKKAEITFRPGEVKNNETVMVTVLDDDAEILWTWQKVLRPRFVELRRIPDSPYLFPGTATPRLVKDKMTLPSGCVSPATMAEMWALGEAHLGLGLTPHQCRHAVATLILALYPGDFGRAATILRDTEETVRRHYGCDSGQAAAAHVRQALLAHHPDLFKQMKRRRAR
ncbi:site-specific integrase [Pikeienuella sp. HZG-20]|uniref:site-specific integrase n=1 Tax=Paludibacillus litoralis TaxID=3133267 RepID=UPI0030ED2439